MIKMIVNTEKKSEKIWKKLQTMQNHQIGILRIYIFWAIFSAIFDFPTAIGASMVFFIGETTMRVSNFCQIHC